MSHHLGRHLAALHARLAHLEGIVERTHRPGPVTDVDYSDKTKPRARIQIGTDAKGEPVKSPWVPISSHAGKRAIHAPVTVGQTMMLVSPDGRFESGVLVHYGFSSKTPSPSTDPNAHVDELGKTKMTLTDGTWKQEVENASIALTKGKIVITAGSSTYTLTDGKIVESATTVVVASGDIRLGSDGASRPLALKGSIDSAGDTEQTNLSTSVKGV